MKKKIFQIVYGLLLSGTLLFGGLSALAETAGSNTDTQLANSTTKSREELEAAVENANTDEEYARAMTELEMAAANAEWGYNLRKIYASHPEFEKELLQDSAFSNEAELIEDSGKDDLLGDDPALNAAIQEALSYAANASGAVEKAMKLHDYLVLNCQYDYTYKNYTAKNALVDHSAVCNGYGLAYKLLCEAAGIECEYVISWSMNHGWNLVKIDNSYYHVDCTWDDPKASSRILRYKYFLRSDMGISDHHSWTGGISADNPRFDYSFWTGIYSEIVKYKDDFYYSYYIADNGEARGLIKRSGGLEYGLESVVVPESLFGYYNNEFRERSVYALSDAILAVNNRRVLAYSPAYDEYEVLYEAPDGQTLKSLDYYGGLFIAGLYDGSGNKVGQAKVYPFYDVSICPGNWKYDAVTYVYKNGVMNGTGEGTFSPNDKLTRAMFATVLYNLEGKPSVNFVDKFPDVPGGKWYSNAVIWANQNGIVNGYPNGNFGTNDNITREQIAVMLKNYSDYKKYGTKQSRDLDDFSDASSVSSWAKNAMSWATASGIISGKKNADGSLYLDSRANATRAECATMMKNFAMAPKGKFSPASIKDEKFKKYLLANVDTNKDGQFSDDEVDAVTSMDLGGLWISDLSGIEYFTNLTTLIVRNNSLKSIDVSALTKLETLDLFNNQLTKVDIKNNPNIKEFRIGYNKLTSLDVSGHDKLELLWAYNMSTLTSIDISGCSSLKDVKLMNNGISEMDLSALSNISVVDLSNNAFESIDLSPLKNCKQLILSGNRLTNIDVSSLENLTTLNVSKNSLTTLNLDNAYKLTTLYCQENELTSISLPEKSILNCLSCYRNDNLMLPKDSSSSLFILHTDDTQLLNNDLRELGYNKLSKLYLYIKGNSWDASVHPGFDSSFIKDSNVMNGVLDGQKINLKDKLMDTKATASFYYKADASNNAKYLMVYLNFNYDLE